MRPKKKSLTAKLYNQRYLTVMILPAFALVLVFHYLPLGGWIIAFKNYQVGLSMFDSPWNGMAHFKTFFAINEDFRYLLRNTLVMNISVLIVNLATAIVFAILLNEIRKSWFARTVQSITFFPFFISGVIMYSFVYALFASSSGAINITLVEWGVLDEGINLLGGKEYSWMLIILLEAWKSLGYNSVIFLAAIAGIPSEQYEAAYIDGAGRFRQMQHITLPNLMPTLVVLLILNSGWILNSNFDLFFLFTNATNRETMEVLDMYIYRYGLQLGNFSYATAVGIMKSVVSIILVVSVNQLAKRITGKSIL